MSNSTFQSYLNIFSIFPYRTLISWDECLNSLKWVWPSSAINCSYCFVITYTYTLETTLIALFFPYSLYSIRSFKSKVFQ